MKALLLLLVFYSLQNVHSFNETVKDTSILLKTYPKKVHPIQKIPQKLVNSARIYRGQKKPEAQVKPKPKYQEIIKKYTVFPKEATLGVFNAPDSPLFPLDFNVEQKPQKRVKKTLRSKRSAPNETDITSTPNPTTKAVTAKPAATKPKVKVVKPGGKGHLKRTTRKIGKHEGKVSKPFNKSSKKSVKKARKPRVRKGEPGKINSKAPKKSKMLRHRKSVRKGKRNLRNIRSKGGKKRILRGRERVRRVLKTNKTSQVRKASRRLIAARDASAEDYPYMASVQKDGEHWCAGALLNRRLIISTANCFWKSNRISRLRVRVGSRFADQGGQVTRIQEMMKHPKWSIRRGPDNDLALALLDRIVRFSHTVHAVDLPNRVMHPPFEDAWVTSFGAERRDGVFQQHGLTLQMYHVRLMSHGKCNNITQRFGIAVSENFICLAQTGRRAPCTRDTGAPAVSDGILWGLASWGIRKLCGTERYPAMFSYVASQSNLDFVMNATRFLMSEVRYNPMLDRLPMVYPTSSPPTVESD